MMVSVETLEHSSLTQKAGVVYRPLCSTEHCQAREKYIKNAAHFLKLYICFTRKYTRSIKLSRSSTSPRVVIKFEVRSMYLHEKNIIFEPRRNEIVHTGLNEMACPRLLK